MKNKKGISLVALTITIVVLIIISSVAIFVSSETLDNADLAAFASDLTQIEDAVKEYYLTNNNLPIEESTSYNKSQVITLISEGSTSLSEEIQENGDDSAVFYIIDMSKLPIEDSIMGNKENGDNKDVYIVSNRNFNVYYLKGMEVKDVYYFSLSKKLTEKTKINDVKDSDESEIDISSTTNGIKLTKNTSDWTNELIVNVETILGINESLEYFIAGQSVNTSTTGIFEIDVGSILNNDETLKNTFYSGSDKTLKVNKYNTSSGSNVLIATTEINISNLDILTGQLVESTSISYTKTPSFILANIPGYTDVGGSGVKEARVLYTQKIDADGNMVAYYENLPNEITAEYVNSAGKTSDYSIIKLPTDVASYVIVYIDNAGNISAPSTYTVTY